MLSRTDAAGTRALLGDGLGSTLGLTDPSGTVTTSYSYEPFGKTSPAGSANANPAQFTGRENDGTGLYYYRSRYYHPGLQRFTSEDPLGFGGGDVNLHAYVGNDPVNLTDPSGENPLLFACAAGAVGGAGGYLIGQKLAGRKATLGGAATFAVGGCMGGLALLGAGSLVSSMLPQVTSAAGGAAACAANSFDAETLVATEEGERPIASIKVGDRVLAYDEATGELGYHAVTATVIHDDPAIVHLTVDGGEVQTTPEHPFYIEDRGWVYAGLLQASDRVREADGTPGTVQAVTVEQRTQAMYNLTVDGAHTFYVGEGQLLVHNACRSGQTLVAIANGAHRLLPRIYRPVTVAAGEDASGELVVAVRVSDVGINAGLAEKAAGLLREKGYNVVGVGKELWAHAEIQLQRAGVRGNIGISNSDGPCPECRRLLTEIGTKIFW